MNGDGRTDPHQRTPRRPLRDLRTRRGPANSTPARHRRAASGHHADADVPEVVGEFRILDGADGERLALQQARVLREVTEWWVQNNSKRGPGRAG
ncbi:MAG: hypothetical protein ACRDRO_01085 [Pseudonocardiaceae bacterium]